MKKLVLISLIALCLAVPIFAQDEPEKIQLPDAVMEQVVKRILTWYFKPRTKQTEIRISAGSIKEEWLPTISNVRFVLVPESPDEASPKIHLFRPVEQEGKVFSIGFGYGEPGCNVIGDLWFFQVVKGRVRLQTNVGTFGSGCSGSVSYPHVE